MSLAGRSRNGVGVVVRVDIFGPESELESESLKIRRLRSPGRVHELSVNFLTPWWEVVRQTSHVTPVTSGYFCSVAPSASLAGIQPGTVHQLPPIASRRLARAYALSAPANITWQTA